MANKKKVHAYTEEFRKEAVRRADQKGNSNQSVAAELGISAQQIYNWRRQFKRCGGNQFSTIQGVKFHQEDSEEVQALKRQLADLKEENAFLKKGCRVLCERPRVKYALIKVYAGQFRITVMCRALRVSRSGYYKYLTRGMPAYQQRRKQVREHVMALFEKYQKRYGAPRLTRALKAENIPCCVNTVAKIMQQLQLRARNGRAFRYSQYSHSNVRVSENVLRRQFVATKPNTKWVTDITYIRFKGQWHYLATVMDLYSRAIVGWAFDGHMTEELIIRALNMAISRREIAPGLIIHSDRGVQYRSVRYQDLIMSIGAVSSMSRRSNCWDNAAMESFFSRMKVELIYGEKFNSLQEIKSCIFEYIEIFYNRVRQHSTLGYVSPYEYEATYA